MHHESPLYYLIFAPYFPLLPTLALIWFVLQHPDRRTGSPSQRGRCWWTPPSDRRCLNTSTPLSSPLESQSHGISWLQPTDRRKWAVLKIKSLEWLKWVSQLLKDIFLSWFFSYTIKNYVEQTLRMCSLGSRLQSARVSSDPSRKLLEDSGTSPEASPSISSGRGVRRKSSRRRRDFSKAFSKAADGGTEQKAHCWLKI